jgi:hypothetical protein
MNIKFTGAYLPSAASISSFTLALILSNSGLKKEIIKGAGKSIELAPRCFT